MEGEGGNREVPSPLILPLRGAQPQAFIEEEGGSWKRYASWDDARSEPEASDPASHHDRHSQTLAHGTGGGGCWNLPTVIVTVVPGRACVPPGGL